MLIQISGHERVKTLLAFIRARSKGQFKVGAEILGYVLETLQELSANDRITIELVSPSGERLAIYSAGGATIGAAVGYCIGAFPGALTGAAIGWGAGAVLASFKISVESTQNGDAIFTLTN